MINSTTSAIAAVLVVIGTPLAVAATSHSAMKGSGSSTAGITKTQAMNEIQTDGYTNVKDLHKEKGAWMASAMEGGKPVSLQIDTHGNVRKE